MQSLVQRHTKQNPTLHAFSKLIRTILHFVNGMYLPVMLANITNSRKEKVEDLCAKFIHKLSGG